MKKIINIIKKSTLPGLEAHKKFAPIGRISNNYIAEPNGATKSAVMILLYKKDNKICFPVIQRVNNGNIHSGQISLPGGHYETFDKTYENNALRETQEEIGVDKGTINIIRPISPLYIPVSNFTVYPFTGYINYVPKFKLQETEAEKLYELQLSELLELKVKTKDILINNKSTKVPFIRFTDVDIWGATAMILYEFASLIKNKI